MKAIHPHVVVMPQVVYVRAASAWLDGDLYIPDCARGVVLFLHGGGSSRHSPRDRLIATRLHAERYATFLFDLLTAEEIAEDVQTGEFRSNVKLLARRVAEVTDALVRDPAMRGLPVAYFATGSGAAAALIAATEKPTRATAIISRGGRPGLAGDALGRVAIPTLLVVGSEDHETLTFNQQAFSLLHCEKELRIIAGAHLFDEGNAVEELETVALDWLQCHLQPETAATWERAPRPYRIPFWSGKWTL